LADVAAEVGMSTASVSLVLRGVPGPSATTRDRVLAAAARLGYRPDRAASLLARRRSRVIGVLLDIRSSFHGEMVEEVHEVADRHGYDVVLSTVTRTRDEQRATETLLDSRCEALMLLGPDATAARLAALDRQLPVVAVGRRIGRPGSDPGVDVVRVADDLGTAEAVGHLADLGHRAIAYVDGGRGTIAADRRRGYIRAMKGLGLGALASVLPGDHTERAGTRAARALLDGQAMPTAVVTFNDPVAVGLLDALNRSGVTAPDLMSVIGYDDSPLARLAHVNLTSVRQDTRALTEHAVAALVERLDGGRSEHREVVLAPKLIVRGTDGPPRAGAAPAGSQREPVP
jgi:DNA-binding LacI/PurR family transcriptional regulator